MAFLTLKQHFPERVLINAKKVASDQRSGFGEREEMIIFRQ